MAERARPTLEDFFGVGRATGVGSLFTAPLSRNVTFLTETFALTNDVTGAICISMLLAVREMPGATIVIRQDEVDTEVPFILVKRSQLRSLAPDRAAPLVEGKADDPNAVCWVLLNNLELIADAEVLTFGQQINVARESGRRHLLNLISCHQVKQPKDANIASYFMSYNSTKVKGGPIRSILDVVMNMLPRVAGHDTLWELVEKNTFVRYHTAYASTPGLIRRALNDIGHIIQVQAELLTALATAEEEWWDANRVRALPVSLIAFTRAYLDAARQLPADWYQGNKAKDAISAATYAKWVRVCRKFLDLRAASEGIDAAGTEEALRDLMADTAFRLDATAPAAAAGDGAGTA
jgi:hypothetical protein